jgi:HEAT repeat protein
MRDSDDLYVNKAADNVEQSIALLKPSPTIWQHVQNWALSNPTWALVLGLYLLWSFTWILLFWFRPLTVLRCNEALMSIDYKLPAWFGGATLPVRYLLIIGFFGYHSRLLDTWVESVAPTARERFKLKETVRDRSVHVALPVILDGTNAPNLNASDLKATFARRIACLLIYGEGGSGKTSLACQIAQWAMAADREQRLTSHVILPVIIEQELDFTVGKDSDILIEAIRRQLQALTDTSEPVTAPHLQALLRRQRILVIIDHLSEMSLETRAKVQPQAANFPVNALIVTSRSKESLGEVAKTVVEPLRVEGNRLSSFMEAYLRQRNARDLFDDTEFFEICKSLSVIVGQRNITVLLAKIYAEQQISRKQGISQDKLPENIPDLMLTYVNHLNRSVGTDRLDEEVLQHDAKIIAWKCLEKSYAPEPANYNEVVTLMGGDDAKQRLQYFENRLNLVRRVEPSAVRFSLDPLAEYLSGLYLVASYGRRANAWRQFISRADRLPSRAGIAGFMLAVRDCCIAERQRGATRGSETGTIPDFVESELALRAAVAL